MMHHRMVIVAAVTTLTATTTACDLEVETVDVPAQACPGEDIGPASYLDVINSGTDDVDSLFHVGWYLSTDATWDASDVLLIGGRDQVDGLGAGEIAEVSIAVNIIPEGTSLGDYYLLTVVDEQDNVDESDENNNVEATPIEIVSCSGVCGDADVSLIESAFEVCPGTAQVGQSAAAGGVTCEEVCCVMGFSGCSSRGIQADFNACSPTPTAPIGSCSDVFGSTWSTQCICTP